MPHIGPALLTTCTLLAACGGSVTTNDVNGNAGNGNAGSAGATETTGTTTGGGMMTEPGMAEAGQIGSAGAAGSGGGPEMVNPSVDASTDSSPAVEGGGGNTELFSLKSEYGYTWKDSWFIRGCLMKDGAAECINLNPCPNGDAADFEDRGATTTEVFPIGGSLGVTYAVTFQVNGISEAKYYQGGTRDAGDMIPANENIINYGLDTFYRGGTPVVSDYGVLRMRVLDSSMKEMARYYMNSGTINRGMESRVTFHLSYSKTIDVPGGGFVEYHTSDANCRSMDNCNDGEIPTSVCSSARGIPHEEANPLPPVAIDPDPAHDVGGKHIAVPIDQLNPVNGKVKPWHSQIVHVTITKAVAK